MSSEKKKKKRKCKDVLRFYLTAFFILLATFSSFAFLFLVPFVIDPGFSTLFAEFDEIPKVCVTVMSQDKIGLTNCSLSASCREGCTRDIYACTQIKVNYRSDSEGVFHGKNYTKMHQLQGMKWDYENAQLYPNVKGCGYPPKLNCTDFHRKYSLVGTIFPCYYSKIQPNITLSSLNIEKVKKSLVYSIVLPWGCFIVSVLYLLITYVGAKKPEVIITSSDELQETSSSKASKDASNYSLRSFSKTLNQGVNIFKKEPEDKGATQVKWRSSPDILLAPASLNRAIIRRDTLPPLERSPINPRPYSLRSRSDPTFNK